MLLGRLSRAPDLVARCARVAPGLDDPDWAALLDAVSVGETRLFRHPEQFAALATLLPVLAARAQAAGRPLRLLSAGCATGEEAWSLAACALHHAPPGAAIEVLGLDLCRPALEAAARGVTGAGLGPPLDLVPEALRPLLGGADGRPSPAPALRRVTRFRRAELRQPFPGLFDVIFCRNVLIYLHEAAREEVMAGLVAGLGPGGVLGLGPTDRAPPGLGRAGFLLWRRDG